MSWPRLLLSWVLANWRRTFFFLLVGSLAGWVAWHLPKDFLLPPQQ